MAATDSRPVPIKNTAYRAVFPILDADGDLVTGAAGLDSEVSKDCGTFADCTNEATEIATSSGIYYLDLTSTEMNADSVAVIVKTSTSGAKTTTLVLYPQESGDIKVDVQSYGGTAGTFASGRPDVNTTHAAGTAWNSGAIGASTLASDTITAAKIAADAIGASELAADAVTEIQSGLATAANLTTVAGYLDTEIAAILADTNELQTDWANGGRLDLILDARASQTSVDTIGGIVDDILTDTADMQPKLGAPAGASLAADIAAIEAQTDDIGTAGAGLTAVPWNAAWDAEVQSEVADALAAFGAATASDVTTAAANVSVDEIQASALADLFNTDSGTDYGSAVPGSVVAEIADNAGGSSLTAADIADAVWDEALSGHAGSGSTGEALAAAGGAGDPWITALPGAYSAGQAGYIVGTNVNATISSRASQTSVDTVDDLLDTEVAAIYSRIGAPVGASISADIAAVKTQTGAIETDTQDLQSRTPAALVSGRMDASVGAMAANVMTAAAAASDLTTELQSGLATATNLATLQTSVDDLPTNAELATALGTADDAVLARLGTPAGASVSADIAAAKADTAAILDDTGTAGVVVATASKTGYRLSSTGVDDVLRTALTEGYATDGATFTLEQAMYMLWSLLAERTIASTTLTAKKLDGSTTAMTFTLDDADAPTSQTRTG